MTEFLLSDKLWFQENKEVMNLPADVKKDKSNKKKKVEVNKLSSICDGQTKQIRALWEGIFFSKYYSYVNFVMNFCSDMALRQASLPKVLLWKGRLNPT